MLTITLESGTNSSVGPTTILKFVGQLTTLERSYKVLSMTGRNGSEAARYWTLHEQTAFGCEAAGHESSFRLAMAFGI
jgi:hypothetical protein